MKHAASKRRGSRLERAEGPKEDSPGQRPGLIVKKIPSPERAKELLHQHAISFAFRIAEERSLATIPRQGMPTEFRYDVFLSHNSADKLRVRRLAEQLKQKRQRV